MKVLDHKIDYVMLITVTNANPNGDPLNGNRPRTTMDGYGEITDVCIKRKLRNALQDQGENIFVQSDDRRTDDFLSLSDRADGNEELKELKKAKKMDADAYCAAACKEWIDVRSFGQVFAFKASKKQSKDDESNGNSVSAHIRGPVTVQSAFSVSPVNITTLQITKSVNSTTTEDGRQSSDTMGLKHRVDFGLYVVKGSISCQLAEKTGFTVEDAEKMKQALIHIFENDMSSARPQGSMAVKALYWWDHESKMPSTSSEKIHSAVSIKLKDESKAPKCFEDYTIELHNPEGAVEPSVYM